MTDVTFYMAALNLRGRRCVVVGAGAVGLEKIQGLLACDARVHVVAPDAHPEVAALAAEGSIEWSQRPYRDEDLERAFLVVAATSDSALNRIVFEAADERSMLVNVVDVPELCNFILPAVVRVGPIAIAISTSGASPALAQRMRDEIGATLGAEYARLAELLAEVRPWAKQNLATYQQRKAFFESIVRGDPDPISLLRAGDEAGVKRAIDAAQRRARV